MGVYDALARGVESGFNMGLQADAATEAKRSRKVQEDRQRAADTRADEDLTLRRGREAREDRRTGVRDRLDLADRAGRALTERQKELVGLSTAAQTAGQPVDPALANEYGQNAQSLAQIRQQALDFFSRAQTGQINPLDAPDADLYLNWTAATGMKPSELPAVAAGANDVTAGLETGNQGLIVQGVNKLMAPQLRIGVGTPSPHGGTITRKEIIGLDPAIDASGRERPDYVIPRMRIYTDEVGPDGKELFYDAPLTQRRTGDPDDPVVAINMKKGMDWMGNLGVLAEAAQNPQIAAKLAAGEKSAGPAADRYLAELTSLGKPKRTPKAHNLAPDASLLITDDNSGELIARYEGKPKTETSLQASQRRAYDALARQRDSKGAAGAGDAAAAGEEDWTVLAQIYLDTGKAPPLAVGRQGSAERAAFRKAVVDEAGKRGMNGSEVVADRATVAGLTKTQADLQKRASAVELFSNKVAKDMKTFDALLDKAAWNTPTLVNKPINFLRRQFSDADLAQLDLAAKQVGAEYERLITGGTLSVAQLHVGAAEDAKKLINGDMPPRVARAVMQTMVQEMKNANAAAVEELKKVNDQIKNRGKGDDGAAPAPAAGGSTPPISALKEGQVTTFGNGQRWTLQNGQPVQVK